MDLTGDFEKVLALIEELEDTPIPPRLKRRIANAYSMATGKAVVLGWYAKTDPETITDETAFRRTLLRHAERGARDFIP